MTLEAFDSTGHSGLTMLFGRRRFHCHVPLLVAASTADVDVLLPMLYLACSERSIDEILDDADSMSPECFRALIKGREELNIHVNMLLSALPEDLMEYNENNLCSGNEPCLRNAQYTRMSLLVNLIFRFTKGIHVVTDHLSPVCPGCRFFVANAIDNKRKELWVNIPSYYGFPSWDILRAKLTEIIEPELVVSIVSQLFETRISG